MPVPPDKKMNKYDKKSFPDLNTQTRQEIHDRIVWYRTWRRRLSEAVERYDYQGDKISRKEAALVQSQSKSEKDGLRKAIIEAQKE